MVFLLEGFWWGLCIGVAGSVLFCRVVRKRWLAGKGKLREKLYK